MNLFFLFTIALAATVSGDVFCKYASAETGSKMYFFMLIAAMCWCSSVVIWTNIYRFKSITETLVLFNPFALLILALAGVFIFKEPVTWKLILSYVLLVTCIWLQAPS